MDVAGVSEVADSGGPSRAADWRAAKLRMITSSTAIQVGRELPLRCGDEGAAGATELWKGGHDDELQRLVPNGRSDEAAGC